MKNSFITKIIGASLAIAMMIGGATGISNTKEAKEVDATAGDVSWRRVTSVDTLLAGGTFILGHEATANSGVIIPMANSGSATTSVAGFMYSGASATSGNSDTINMSTVTTTSSYEVTVGESSVVDGAIYIKIGNYYLGNTNTKNNCKLFTSQSETTSFTATKLTNDKMELDIKANNSGSKYRYLKYNTGSPRFAVYASGQQNPVFYQKIIEQSITGSTEAYIDETVALTSSASTTVTWSIVAADTTATGAFVTNSGVVSVTGAGIVKVKAVANGYSDAVHLITFNERPAGPYYTVTFDSNGGSISPANMIIAEGETFEFPSPGEREHYSFDGWTSTGSAPYHAANSESPAVTADVTYAAHWTEDAKYTVTYFAGSNGAGSYADENNYGGTYTLKAFNTLTGISAADGYRFKSYTVGGADKNPGDTLTLDSSITVTVNFEVIPLIDTLTAAYIDKATYGDWSDKNGTNSTAVYAGHSQTSSNNAIQIRTKNDNSGIVTTTSGGKLAKIVVSWNTTDFGSTTNRTLDVYGKNEAYVSATDLYNANTQGTKIGSITYTNSTSYETELTISGYYRFLGLRSNDGALYIDEIAVEWKTTTTQEMIERTFTTNATLSYHYSGNAQDGFEYSNISIRFGGLVSKDLWNELDTNEHNITGFGVMIADGELIKNSSDFADALAIGDFTPSTVSETFNKDVYAIDFFIPIANMASTIGEDENNYFWNLRWSIDSAIMDEMYSAVAYIKVGDEYVFMNMARESVETMATKYVNSGSYSGAVGDSLQYIVDNIQQA